MARRVLVFWWVGARGEFGQVALWAPFWFRLPNVSFSGMQLFSFKSLSELVLCRASSEKVASLAPEAGLSEPKSLTQQPCV